MTTTLQITTPRFVAAVIISDRDRIIQTAPILAWTIGRTEDWLRYHCKLNGWKIIRLKDKIPGK